MPDENTNRLEGSLTEPSIICPHCNAKQLGPSETCWLCHQPLADTLAGMPRPVILRSMEPERMSFSLATLFLVVTLASVCMGLLVAVPGLGVMACIVMVPVVIRTSKVVRRREAAGKQVGSAEKVMLFLTSYAVASVVVVVVCVSTFCSFCGVCLSIVSVGSGEPAMMAWGAGLCLVAVLGFVSFVKLIRWSFRRYRRDIGED